MAETIHEQIAQWITAAIDGQADPGGTITLRAVRPKILDWSVEDFVHGDVIIEAADIKTQSKTSRTRTELGTWGLYGVIRRLPADTAADTVMSRMIETIRRLLMAGNSAGRACGGLAYNIDCSEGTFDVMTGGVIAFVTAAVLYPTNVFDGYI